MFYNTVKRQTLHFDEQNRKHDDLNRQVQKNVLCASYVKQTKNIITFYTFNACWQNMWDKVRNDF